MLLDTSIGYYIILKLLIYLNRDNEITKQCNQACMNLTNFF